MRKHRTQGVILVDTTGAEPAHVIKVRVIIPEGIILEHVLQVAAVQLPVFNRPFGTTPMALRDWALSVTLASMVLWADEAKKLFLRKAHASSR